MANILMIHGWAENIEVYKPVVDILYEMSNEVMVFKIAGMDDRNRRGFNSCIKGLRNILMYNTFDTIYVHSMGIVLLSKCADLIPETTNVFLDNPVCGDNLRVRYRLFKPLINLGLMLGLHRNETIASKLLTLVTQKENISMEAIDMVTMANGKTLAEFYNILCSRSIGAFKTLFNADKFYYVLNVVRYDYLCRAPLPYLPLSRELKRFESDCHSEVLSNPNLLAQKINDTALGLFAL